MTSEFGDQPVQVARHAVLAELAPYLRRVDAGGEDPGRELVRQGVARIKWVVDIQRCTYARLHEDGVHYSLTTLHEADDDADVIERAGIPLAEGVAGQVLLTGETCLIEHPSDQPVDAGPTVVDTVAHGASTRALVTVPVRASDGKTASALTFVTRTASLDAHDVRYLEAVAEQLGLGLERLGLERRLRLAEDAAARETAARRAAEDNASRAGRTTFENKRVSELLKANARLREDIENHVRAATELRHAKNAAEADSRAKSAFLVNMSHELRNTLNAIIGYGEMLQEQAEDEGYEDIIPDLGRICMSGQYLMSTINDIINMSKIQGGRVGIKVTTFSVAAMVQEVAAAVEPLIEQRGNRLDVQVDDELGDMTADSGKVRQVLFNVLMASSRLTQDGEISVSVYRDMFRGRARFVFLVRDNGRGMTQSQLLKTFATFSGGTPETPDAAESGSNPDLGLAISRYFSELMGGQVTVDSRVGLGSTFTIRLPANMAGV